MVIWPHHGIMSAGQSMDDAFGLIETAEKAAEIYLKISSTTQPVLQTITDQQLWDLADAFQVVPKAGVLEAKK